MVLAWSHSRLLLDISTQFYRQKEQVLREKGQVLMTMQVLLQRLRIDGTQVSLKVCARAQNNIHLADREVEAHAGPLEVQQSYLLPRMIHSSESMPPPLISQMIDQIGTRVKVVAYVISVNIHNSITDKIPLLWIRN